MSSGSPSQIVHEVGGPVRGSPSRRQTGCPASLPQRSCSARVDRRLRRLLARARGEPGADLLERERVVAEQRLDLVEERRCRGRRLAVALDRRGLAEPGHAAVRELDVDDVRRVRRLARDHEGLAQLERRDPGREPHVSRLCGLAPVAQGIERAPPERKVAGSIPARRIRPARSSSTSNDLYTATRHYIGWYALEGARARRRATSRSTSATRTAASWCGKLYGHPDAALGPRARPRGVPAGADRARPARSTSSARGRYG